MTNKKKPEKNIQAENLICPFLPDELDLCVRHFPASPTAHQPSASHLLHRSPHPTGQFCLWTSAGPDRGQTDKGVAPMRSAVAGLLLPPTPALGPPRPALRVYTACPWWCIRCSRITGHPPKPQVGLLGEGTAAPGLRYCSHWVSRPQGGRCGPQQFHSPRAAGLSTTHRASDLVSR